MCTCHVQLHGEIKQELDMVRHQRGLRHYHQVSIPLFSPYVYTYTYKYIDTYICMYIGTFTYKAGGAM